MRKKEIKCPYCGSKAKLVHFYDKLPIAKVLPCDNEKWKGQKKNERIDT